MYQKLEKKSVFCDPNLKMLNIISIVTVLNIWIKNVNYKLLWVIDNLLNENIVTLSAFPCLQMNWYGMEAWAGNLEKLGQDRGMDAPYWNPYSSLQGTEPADRAVGGWNPGGDQQQNLGQSKQWTKPPSTGMEANFEVWYFFLRMLFSIIFRKWVGWHFVLVFVLGIICEVLVVYNCYGGRSVHNLRYKLVPI